MAGTVLVGRCEKRAALIYKTCVILAITKPLGIYMFCVFEGERQPVPGFFGPIERGLYRLCGVDPKEQQKWTDYTIALLLFSDITLLVMYAIERLQHVLPLNPRQFGPVPEHLAFNTAASFTPNTNWQSYSGESTMSYLTQMAGLAWHNFISAAVGIGVALALARGLTYQLRPSDARMLGNFWVDLIRPTVYVLLPLRTFRRMWTLRLWKVPSKLSRWGRLLHKKPSRSSAPMAVASSTQTALIPLRVPHR